VPLKLCWCWCLSCCSVRDLVRPVPPPHLGRVRQIPPAAGGQPT
jgi:hypothetical protein